MYSKKYTNMNFWYKMKTMKQLDLLHITDDYHILQKHQPSLNMPNPKNRYNQGVSHKNNLEKRIVQKLFKFHPELQFIPKSQSIPSKQDFNTSSENIYNFIESTKFFMKQGFSEDAAYTKAEKKYQQQLEKKIEQCRLSRGLAFDNQSRSFLNIYQQIVEKEARLKVERMQQDIAKQNFIKQNYEQIQNEKKLELQLDELVAQKQQQQQQNEDDLSDYEDNIQNDKPDETGIQVQEIERRLNYTRLLHKMIRKGEINDKAVENRDPIQNFIEGNENLFQHYYERASTLDKIQGLTEHELKLVLRTSPVQFQKQNQKLLKLLNKHHITLDNRGEVDYSKCEDATIINRLYYNPYVKMVLMQKDLQFEIPYKQHKSALALKYKQQLEELKNIGPQDIEKNLTEEQQKEQAFNLEYEDVVIKNFTNMETHNIFEEDRRFNQSLTGTERIRNEKLEPILNSINDKESYYRFFENYGERLKRIETQWLKNRIAELENSIDSQTLQEKHKELNKLVQQFRKLKFRLEQDCYREAGQLLFEEHSVFTQKDLDIDRDNTYEELLQYLQLDEEKRKHDWKAELQDKQIQKLVKPKIVELDVADPVNEEYRFKQSSQDSLEQQSLKYKQDYEKLVIKRILHSNKMKELKSNINASLNESFDFMEMADNIEEGQGDGKEDDVQIDRKEFISQIKKNVQKGKVKKQTDFMLEGAKNQQKEADREKIQLEKEKKEKEAAKKRNKQ